jgi:hypothetical protein
MLAAATIQHPAHPQLQQAAGPRAINQAERGSSSRTTLGGVALPSSSHSVG